MNYGWRLGGSWYSMQATASHDAELVATGSEEEFITEHYWGYTKLHRGGTSEYEVARPRWRIYPIESFAVDVSFARLYGVGFAAMK